ncbi:hypothetical protein B4147_1544 [Bacillus wiedmannii]|uniref:Uncharacterized protein n=1 Tax=Bacillus wiedmannii TaxID=1890302 RepID=A0A0G8BXI3_9BACI|nr:hypothetical protein B4147_1544 [Bacillus wiedmannii]
MRMITYIVNSKVVSFRSRFIFFRSLTEKNEHKSRTAIDIL